MAIQEVIKYGGDNRTLIWKHPAEDFNTLSKLIVSESQVAVFFSDGQALDTFRAGKYTLETGNIPLISALRNLVTGGVSQFHCEVYFINMVEFPPIPWGTPSPVPVTDPLTEAEYSTRANGTYSIKVREPRKFLIEFNGTEEVNTISSAQKYFKGRVIQKVNGYISNECGKYSYKDINKHLNDIADSLQGQLEHDFERYGIGLALFTVDLIRPIDEDLARLQNLKNRVVEARADREAFDVYSDQAVIEAEKLAKARQIQGYTWQEEKQFEINQTFAGNEGFAANPANMVAQVPVAMAMGGMLSQSMSQNLQNQENVAPTRQEGRQITPTAAEHVQTGSIMAAGADLSADSTNTSGKVCPQCGEPLQENARFCFMCGAQIVPQKKTCPKCGNETEGRAVFCPMCGERFES